MSDQNQYKHKLFADNFAPGTSLPQAEFINRLMKFRIGRNVPAEAVGLLYFENPDVHRRYNLKLFNNLVNNNQYLNSYSNTEQRCFSDEDRDLNETQLNVLSPNNAMFYYEKPVITDITKEDGKYRYYYKHDFRYPIDKAKVLTLGEDFKNESTLGLDRCYLEYDIRYHNEDETEMVMPDDQFIIYDTYGNKVNDKLDYRFYYGADYDENGNFYIYASIYLSKKLKEDYYIAYNPFNMETGEEYQELISAEPIFEEVTIEELNQNINNLNFKGYVKTDISNGFNITVPVEADITQQTYHNYIHETDEYINYECEVMIDIT